MATNLSQSHYNFAPSLPAAIIWASLYSIAFAVTFFQWIKYRAWVWVVMVLAAGSKPLLISTFADAKNGKWNLVAILSGPSQLSMSTTRRSMSFSSV